MKTRYCNIVNTFNVAVSKKNQQRTNIYGKIESYHVRINVIYCKTSITADERNIYRLKKNCANFKNSP